MDELNVELKKTHRKDYFSLEINDVVIGIFERSQLRYLMEKVDNAI